MLTCTLCLKDVTSTWMNKLIYIFNIFIQCMIKTFKYWADIEPKHFNKEGLVSDVV